MRRRCFSLLLGAAALLAQAQTQPVPSGISSEQAEQLKGILRSASADVAPAAAGTTFLIRQAGQQMTAAATKRETAFVKSKANSASEALKAEALSQAINLAAVTIASKVAGNVPYLGSMVGMLGRLPGLGGGKVTGFEFDYLQGLNADLKLRPGVVEIAIPPAAAIPAAAGATFEPMLLRLKPVDKDKVRIIVSRKVQLTPAKTMGIGSQQHDAMDREVVSAEYDAVAVSVQKNGDGSAVLRTSQSIAEGEYALVLNSPEPKAFRLLEPAVAFRVQ
jgi:ABC-type amino acid transport substrate-binding protein